MKDGSDRADLEDHIDETIDQHRNTAQEQEELLEPVLESELEQEADPEYPSSDQEPSLSSEEFYTSIPPFMEGPQPENPIVHHYTIHIPDDQGGSQEYNILGGMTREEAQEAAQEMHNESLLANEQEQEQENKIEGPEGTFEKSVMNGLIEDIESRDASLTVDEADRFYVALGKLANENYLSSQEMKEYAQRVFQNDPRSIDRNQEIELNY